MELIKCLFTVKIFLTLSVSLGFSQDYKVLQIGDTIPESFYKEVAELGSAGEAFYNSKGKLVILDFWSTYCATCIESMPKMKEIQEEFQDEIQLFFVNTFEDNDRVAKRMQTPALKRYAVDLPSITNAKVFQKLFPHKLVPHHVWIDGEGIVRIIGSPLNTNNKKIREVLNGKVPFNLKGPNNSKKVDTGMRLHDLENKKIKSKESSFLFTRHNNDYSADYVSKYEDVYDSVHLKTRNTYINNDVLDLYQRVFWEDIRYQTKNVIYNGMFSANSGYWRGFFILDMVDTLQLSSNYIPYLNRTDQEYIKSKFCYEQLCLPNWNSIERNSYMLANLNKYFGEHLGIEAGLIEKEIDCYVLKKESIKFVHDEIEGITPLNGVLYNLIFRLFSKKPQDYLPFMVDETGLTDLTGLLLPEHGSDYTFEEITLALEKIGVTIYKKKRKFKFVSIRKI